MKNLLLAALLCASVADAAAQCPSATDTAAFSFTTSPWPIDATATPAVIRSNSAGWLAYWYGPARPDGSHSLSMAFLTSSMASTSYFAALAADLAASGVNAALQARSSLSMNDPAAVAIWCPFWPEMLAGMNLPPAASPDGTLAPPAATLIAGDLAVWSIVNGWAVRNGVQTNGHATALLVDQGGKVFAKSPTGGIWWLWTGANAWQKLTVAQP